MTRLFRVLLLAGSALAASGCFHLATVVRVRGDGSGTIQQRLVFTQAALDQLKQLAVLGGREAFDPLSEDEARAGAERFGTGVTLLSTTAIQDESGRGRESVYAFNDVSQIHISQQPAVPRGVVREIDSNSEALTATLKKLPNGNGLLTIVVPQPGYTTGRSRPGSVNGLPEQMAFAKEMFRGAQISFAAEPFGALVKTNSAFVDGSRVTLLDVNLDQLMQDETLPARLQAAKNADELKAILKDAPGLKVNFDREITIEFKPAP